MAVGIKDKVQFNVSGQTLAYEAPQGRPSGNGTVALYDSRYPQTDTAHNPIGSSGTATLRAVSTTLTAAAGAAQNDPRNVPVVPPGALKVGDFVLLTNASGQVERGEVVAKSASSVTLRDPLEYDYAIAATFESAVMDSPAIDATWLSSTQNLVEDCYAIWTYTVAGKSYSRRTYFDVVREIVSWDIPDSLLFARYPDFRRFKFEDRPSFADMRATAVRDVEQFVVGRGLSPNRMKGAETIQRLVELRFWVTAAENGFYPVASSKAEFLTERINEWTIEKGLVVDGAVKLPYDTNNDDVIAPDERRVTQRRLRR